MGYENEQFISFCKKNGQPIRENIRFDFSFSLHIEVNLAPVEKIFSRVEKEKNYYRLSAEDNFLHLCCHLHKEASDPCGYKIIMN
jgi:hypothetical protein